MIYDAWSILNVGGSLNSDLGELACSSLLVCLAMQVVSEDDVIATHRLSTIGRRPSVRANATTQVLLLKMYELEERLDQLNEELEAQKKCKADETFVRQLLTLKSDQIFTYTKKEVDALMSLKADQATTPTLGQFEERLAEKAGFAEVYSREESYHREEVDALLKSKAWSSVVERLREEVFRKAELAETYSRADLDAAPDVEAAPQLGSEQYR